MMVFAFMLVVVLMDEARKPQHWKWIWQMTAAPEQAGPSDEPVDTRLPPRAAPDDSPPGTIYASEPAGELPADFEDADERQRVRLDIWRAWLKGSDRSQQQLLMRLLRASRNQTQLDDQDLAAWRAVDAKLKTTIQEYLAKANEAVLVSGEELPPQQKERLISVLSELEADWTGVLGPALQAPLEDRPWTKPEIEALDHLQATLDQLALANIRDDMVWRPAEQTAWFRILEKLQRADPRNLAAESVGTVGFVQLFRQPDEYRGRVVTVKGTAELAYRVKAPQNDLGISGYYVFWLRPADGSDSPIVVYSLELPDRFPAIGDDHTQLNEDVAFTGYFFKRWAYGARDGIRTAPLLVAKSPTWHFVPADSTRGFPSPQIAAAAILAVALLAIGIAAWAYRTSNALVGTRTLDTINPPDPQGLKSLSKQDVGPSVAESLRKLSNEGPP